MEGGGGVSIPRNPAVIKNILKISGRVRKQPNFRLDPSPYKPCTVPNWCLTGTYEKSILGK